jgi:hypothetical protein
LVVYSLCHWGTSEREEQVVHIIERLDKKTEGIVMNFDISLMEYLVIWYIISKVFHLQLMKMEHIKLSEEALAYKNCVADMEDMRFTIVSTSRSTCWWCLVLVKLSYLSSALIIHLFCYDSEAASRIAWGY